jgi:hypothetical protein
MNDPTDDVAPEETAITARLDALPAQWVTSELRSAAAQQARAAAFHREATQALADAREAVQIATAARDLLALQAAAAEVIVADAVLASIPPVAGAVSVPVVTDPARQELSSAMGSLPGHRLFDVAAELESAAFETWPQRLRLDNRGPITLPTEDEAIAAVKLWRAESDSLALAIQSWESPAVQGDTITALQRAVSLVAQAKRLGVDGVALAERVAHLNAERQRMGIEWQPHGVHGDDTWPPSPERRALDRFRADREAVPA